MNENGIKPGPKTSEFWLTVALVAIATVASMIPIDSEYGWIGKGCAAILAAASVYGYNVSRGMVKQRPKEGQE